LRVGIDRISAVADLDVYGRMAVLTAVMMTVTVIVIVIVIVIVTVTVTVTVTVLSAVPLELSLLQEIVDYRLLRGRIDVWRKKVIDLCPVQIVRRHVCPYPQISRNETLNCIYTLLLGARFVNKRCGTSRCVAENQLLSAKFEFAF